MTDKTSPLYYFVILLKKSRLLLNAIPPPMNFTIILPIQKPNKMKHLQSTITSKKPTSTFTGKLMTFLGRLRENWHSATVGKSFPQIGYLIFFQ